MTAPEGVWVTMRALFPPILEDFVIYPDEAGARGHDWGQFSHEDWRGNAWHPWLYQVVFIPFGETTTGYWQEGS